MYICTVSIGRYCIGGKDNMMKVDVFVYYIYTDFIAVRIKMMGDIINIYLAVTGFIFDENIMYKNLWRVL